MFLRLHKGVSSPLCHRWESKQQPGVDLDTGVHLKKKKKTTRRSELLPSSPPVLSLLMRCWLHCPAERSGRKLSRSSCAQLSLPALPGQGPWASPGILLAHSRYPGSSLQPGSSPPPFWSLFFLRPLLTLGTPLFQGQLCFPEPQGLGSPYIVRVQKPNTCLLTSASGFCLLINWRIGDVPLV